MTGADATIKVLNAPLHGPSWSPAVGSRAFDSNADFIAFSEGYKAWPWLRDNSDQYVSHTCLGQRVDSRGRNVGWDVVVSVRRDWSVVSSGSFWLDQEIAPNKYHPERHGVWVLARNAAGKKVLLVFIHPQPGGTTEIRQHYDRSMERLKAQVNALVLDKDPDLVLCGGDMQHTTAPAFGELGLASEHNGVIFTAWSRTWERVGGWLISDAPGTDHPWIVTVLKEK